MVAWFKRDVPAWMDGTEELTDGEYRAYDVICNLIYLREGPISLNEKGIAGRCNQPPRTFRKHLEGLVAKGKLAIDSGKISNERASLELEKLGKSRETSSKGGENSGVSRRNRSNEENKPLKNNDKEQGHFKELEVTREQTRLEKTREESTPSGVVPKGRVKASALPEAHERARKAYFDRATEVLGVQAKTLAGRLYVSFGGDGGLPRSANDALAAVNLAGGARDKRSYLGAVIRKNGERDHVRLDENPWDGNGGI